MDTKKLRQKILDLAIRGKLVPQDPNDEPASILIEKIRAEKERFIKDKKIKRDKNESYIYRSDKSYYEKFADGTVKCIDEEIPFEIPDSWEWVRWRNLFLSNPKNEIEDDLDVSFVPMTNIKDGYFNESISNIKLWGNVKTGFTHFQDGDLGIAKITPCFENRKSVVFRNLHNSLGAGTTELHIFRPILFSNLASYALYIAKTDSFIQHGVKNFTGAVGQQRVGKDIIGDYLIALPPMEEMAKILSTVSDLFLIVLDIENNGEKLSTYVKNTKSKILDLAIRGKLVPQEPDDEPASVLLERIKKEHPESKKKSKNISDISHYTFDIPKTWKWTTIGTIAEHNTGKTLDKGRNTGILHKYITTSNLYWDSFVLDDLKEMPFEENELGKCSAIKGDLLICEGGDGGRSAIWSKEYPICFQNHVHRVRPFSGIKSKYIYFFMLYSYLNGYINYYKKGIGIQSLSGNSLSSIKIPLPPISEQGRIIEKVEDIFTSLDKVVNSIEA